ncbi:MAG: hypothetical protein M1334_01165 [Patescibacteria group bacterium]|nr:hypothetical protein [Patescibacteria group bacterium]
MTHIKVLIITKLAKATTMPIMANVMVCLPFCSRSGELPAVITKNPPMAMAIGAKITITSVIPKEIKFWPRVNKSQKRHEDIAVPGPQGTRGPQKGILAVAKLITGKIKAKTDGIINNLSLFFIVLIITNK